MSQGFFRSFSEHKKRASTVFFTKKAVNDSSMLLFGTFY